MTLQDIAADDGKFVLFCLVMLALFLAVIVSAVWRHLNPPTRSGDPRYLSRHWTAVQARTRTGPR